MHRCIISNIFKKFFLLKFLDLALVANSLILFTNCFCLSLAISIVIMSFLIGSPKLRIILNFAESYIVLYHLKIIVVLSMFCFCSLVISSSFIILEFSILSKMKTFIDVDFLSGNSKDFKARTCFSLYFSIVSV